MTPSEVALLAVVAVCATVVLALGAIGSDVWGTVIGGVLGWGGKGALSERS